VIDVSKEHKLTKIGPASTAVILPKEWVDNIKTALKSEDIIVKIFGSTKLDFLVLEVKGLPIKTKKAKNLLKKCKKHFSVK